MNRPKPGIEQNQNTVTSLLHTTTFAPTLYARMVSNPILLLSSGICIKYFILLECGKCNFVFSKNAVVLFDLTRI